MTTRSALYAGTVVHRRTGAVDHDLRQRVVMGLFDLDDLVRLDREVRGFGVDRVAPVAFRSRDHGRARPDDDVDDLRAWVAQVAGRAGVDDVSGPIQVLAMPRVLGYAFDPISVWFAHDRAGHLAAVVHEVRNTFGHRHAYVVGAPMDGATVTASGTVLRHHAAKALHVSPFFAVAGTYDFTLRRPDAIAAVAITYRAGDGHVLTASFTGRRHPFTTRGLWSQMLRHPLLPQAVTAGIHAHAGLLWRRGASYHAVPVPPRDPVSLGRPVPSSAVDTRPAAAVAPPDRPAPDRPPRGEGATDHLEHVR